MKHIMSRPGKTVHQLLPIFSIVLLVSLLAFSTSAMAGAAVDCEGSARAYRLQGIPCDCVNGQIVCNQSSGKSSKKSSGSLSPKNAVKMQMFQGVLDAVFLSPKDQTSAQQQQDANRQYEQKMQMREKELELERQKNFSEKRDQLLAAMKGSSSKPLELKTDDNKEAPVPTAANLAVLREQDAFDNMNAEWLNHQKQIIEQRLAKPNKYANAIYKSLKTNAPPLPWKTFNELASGDVLLLEGEGFSKAITGADNLISTSESRASHTVLYLKEVNGKKLFLDNQPGVGPRVISEDLFMATYGHRGAEVAKLAQPLNPKEAKKLFTAAMELAQKNNKEIVNNWFGKPLPNTNYGIWGKDNVVCSEADWAIINAGGRNIPKSGDRIKVAAGVDYSPADFSNSQFFLVTPLVMPSQ